MADIQEELCAFCKEGEDAGTLRNTSDDDILAHYNCLLFSPRVITRPQDSQDNTVEFDITSVKKEIKRGKKLKCSYCNKAGATVGCNVRKCWRTYHYQCVTKHKGIRIRNEDEEQYIAYCFEHSEKDQDAKDCLWNNHSKRSGIPITPSSSNESRKNKTPKKRKEKMENSIARKAMRFEEEYDSGIVQNAKMRSDGEQELHIHSSEDMEVPGPSRTYLEHEDFCIKHGSGSGSDVQSSESNGSHSAQIKIEQNAGMLVESERMQIPSNHRYHDHMEIPGSSTSFLQQGQPGIVNRSSIKTEEDLQILIGSPLASIKRENSTEDDTSVTIIPSRVFSQTLPSPSRERAIFIGSHMKTEEDLPTERKENSMEDDTSVAGTPSRVFQETLPSTSRERTSSSSTDSSGSWTPEILRSVSFSSLDISTNNDCDDQNTGTYAASTGTPVHATSVLQRPRHSPGLASSPSQQPINNANKQAFPVKESLKKEAPTSREETPPTSPDVKGGKAADVQSVTFHPSPLHIKKLSDQLKKGVFCKDFKKITLQFPSTAEPVMTSPSKLQSKEDDLASEKSPEHSIVSQQAQKDFSNVDGNLENSGQTTDEPGSSGDLQEDRPMLVEKITHTIKDTVPLSEKTLQTPWKLLHDPVCPNLNAEVKTASSGAPATHELHMYSAQLAMQSCSRESTSNWGTDERKEELEQAAEELPNVSTIEHEQQINQLQVCQERRSADSFLNPNNPRAIFCNYLFHILEDIDGDLATQCMDHLCTIAIQYRTAKKMGIPLPTYPSTVSQGPPV